MWARPTGVQGPRTAAALDAFRRDSGLPGGAGPTATDAVSLYARVHWVAPAARPAGSMLLAGTSTAMGPEMDTGTGAMTAAGALDALGGAPETVDVEIEF